MDMFSSLARWALGTTKMGPCTWRPVYVPPFAWIAWSRPLLMLGPILAGLTPPPGALSPPLPKGRAEGVCYPMAGACSPGPRLVLPRLPWLPTLTIVALRWMPTTSIRLATLSMTRDGGSPKVSGPLKPRMPTLGSPLSMPCSAGLWPMSSSPRRRSSSPRLPCCPRNAKLASLAGIPRSPGRIALPNTMALGEMRFLPERASASPRLLTPSFVPTSGIGCRRHGLEAFARVASTSLASISKMLKGCPKPICTSSSRLPFTSKPSRGRGSSEVTGILSPIS